MLTLLGSPVYHLLCLAEVQSQVYQDTKVLKKQLLVTSPHFPAQQSNVKG